jgi:ubiquinone/menaquinone biosynthesis C-methylase UbiE
MARVLDLGCGSGKLPVSLLRENNAEVVGVDINPQAIALARQTFPERQFECARGESLPFPDSSFESVVSSVALPYMDIPCALAEARRVLTPGGQLSFTLHPPTFTLGELQKCRRPIPLLYRLYVLLNGTLFHLTGKTRRAGRRCESFQTERGMRIALERAGFAAVTFTHSSGTFVVNARTAFPAREATSVTLTQPITAS